MAGLQLGQRITHHFLSKAGAFSTFTRNTQCFTDFTITAAAFQNCIPDLTVGDTLAEANIHKLWTVAGLLLGAEELNVNENACQNCFGLYSDRAMSGCFRRKRFLGVPSESSRCRHEKTGTRPVHSRTCRPQSSKSCQPPISFQRLTMPQNSSAVFSVS